MQDKQRTQYLLLPRKNGGYSQITENSAIGMSRQLDSFTGVGATVSKNKGRVVLRGDIVKDDSGSYAAFTEQGSSASQMTAAKVMN